MTALTKPGGTIKREVASELFRCGTGQPCTGKPRSQTLRLFIPPFARVCCPPLENSLSSTTTSQSIWHNYEGQEYDVGVKIMGERRWRNYVGNPLTDQLASMGVFELLCHALSHSMPVFISP
jgi:hypothetical protein